MFFYPLVNEVLYMKVDFSARLTPYQKNSPGNAKTQSAKQEAKTDIAEFSRGHTAMSDKRLIGLKSSLQADLYAPASADRLAELKQRVKDGSYMVPTRVLVDAILGKVSNADS